MKNPAQLYGEVRNFQPEEIIQYLADHEEISLGEARERWDEMLKFMVLCVTSDRVHAPSEKVDTAWHAFIMHTEAYEEFCLEQLGRFIHHRPIPNPVEQFENSLEEVFTSFPDSPVRRHIWAGSQQQVAECGDCIGMCAEVGCSRIRSERSEKLPAVVAFGIA